MIQALPLVEVLLDRVLTASSAVKSGLVPYSAKSGIGYYMARKNGYKDQSAKFLDCFSALRNLAVELASHQSLWSGRLNSLQKQVQALGMNKDTVNL